MEPIRLLVHASLLAAVAGLVAPPRAISPVTATRMMAASLPLTSLPGGISTYSKTRRGDDVGFYSSL
jgi:hypothetical protein